MKTDKIVISKHLLQRLDELINDYVPRDASAETSDNEASNANKGSAISYVIDAVAKYAEGNKGNSNIFTKEIGGSTYLCGVSDSVIREQSALRVSWSFLNDYISEIFNKDDAIHNVKIDFRIPDIVIRNAVKNSNIYSVNGGKNQVFEVNTFKNQVILDLILNNKLSDGIVLGCVFSNAIAFWMIPKNIDKSSLSGIKFLGANLYKSCSFNNGEIIFNLSQNEKDLTNLYMMPCKAMLCLNCTLAAKSEVTNKNQKSQTNLQKEGTAPGCFPLELLRRMDNIRVALPCMNKSQLTSPTEGGIEVFAPGELPSDDYTEIPLDIPCVAKDPWERLVDEDSCVIIDFGTSSTVVAYRDSQGIDRLLRMSGFDQVLSDDQYENPTALEFKNYENFISTWQNEQWRPLTEWEHGVISSGCAKVAVKAHPTSCITNIKSWARKRHNSIPLRLEDDEMEKDFELFPLPVEDCSDDKDLGCWNHRPLDPIEVYGYHLGLYLNTQTIRGGSIFLNYMLTYPVMFDNETKNRILQGLRRGLLRSMPPSVVFSPKWRDARFSVEYGASEPEALACSVLPGLGIDCEFEDQPFAIFDFGGGTADYAAGLYRKSTDIEIAETGAEKTIEILGTSGDASLGGEHIINLLCYSVIKNNADLLMKNKITFVLPEEEGCVEFQGSELLWGQGTDSFGNLQKLRNELRLVWENDKNRIDEINSAGGVVEAFLMDSNGETKQLTLKADYEELMKIIKDRIRKGVESFYVFFLQTFYNIKDQVKKLHVIFSGNSCRTPVLKDVFADVKGRIIGESPEIAKLSAEFKKLIKEHYEFVDQWRNKDSEQASAETSGETSDNAPRLTLKNCVALGMLKLISDNDINLKYDNGGEAPFNYTVGTFKNHFLVPIFPRCSQYGEWKPFAKVLAPRFRGEFGLDVGWSPDPKASSPGENIPQTGCKHKMVHYSKEFNGYEICICAVKPNLIKLGCFADNSSEPVIGSIREIYLD